MKTTLDFLKRVYFPGYMTITDIDFSGNNAYFNFRPVEPPVMLYTDYFTPRGVHISISQASPIPSLSLSS